MSYFISCSIKSRHSCKNLFFIYSSIYNILIIVRFFFTKFF